MCISLAQVSGASKVGLRCPSEMDTDEISLETSEDPAQLGDALPDFNCFRAAWIADNAETACSTTQANDGSDCVWCQSDAMGACVMIRGQICQWTVWFGLVH